MDGSSRSRSSSSSSNFHSIDDFSDFSETVSVGESSPQEITTLEPNKTKISAQEWLKKIATDIGKLPGVEQNKFNAYVKNCTDILNCLPSYVDTEDSNDEVITLSDTATGFASAKRKRIELKALLSIEFTNFTNLLKALPSKNKELKENIQIFSEYLNDVANAADQHYARQEEWFEKIKPDTDRLVKTEYLAKKIEAFATQNNIFGEKFKVALDAFQKVPQAHIAKIKLNDDEGNGGPDLTKLIDDIAKARNEIDAFLNGITGSKEKTSAAFKLLAETRDELDHQIFFLGMREEEIRTHVSSLSPAAVMGGRMLQVQAAILVIDEIKSQYGNANIQKQVNILKARLLHRQKAMQEVIDGKKNLQECGLAELLGKPPMSAMQKILFPKMARKQERDIHKILKDGLAGDVTLFHPNVTEKDLMLTLINQHLIQQCEMNTFGGDVHTLLERASARYLNQQRHWGVIDSVFTVPVAGISAKNPTEKSIAKHAVVVDTQTTPIGNLFEGATVKVVSEKSPISSGDFSDYKAADPKDPQKTITTGRNSHSATEGKHAVNLARSVCTLFGKVILSVSRHATLSPYKFSRSSLKSMPEGEARALMEHLGKLPVNVTRITVDPFQANGSNDKLLNRQKVDIDLLKAIRYAMILHSGKDFTTQDAEALMAEPEALLRLARTDQSVCSLLRRKAALNRAREVFLSEVTGNPDLLQRIAKGRPIVFNSFSLLTPDPMRAFFSTHFPGLVPASDNEMRMLADQEQAWDDLEAEIKSGALEINGQVVVADIHSMNIGVNPLALKSLGPLSRDLTSGWSNTHEHNEASIKAMIGEVGSDNNFVPGGRLKIELDYKQSQLSKLQIQLTSLEFANNPADADKITKLQQEFENIERSLKTMNMLARQIAEIWQSESYQHGGREPYKLAARLAMLSSMMGEATVFNCKSGKDRTAQLDIELKFLAFQIHTNNGDVPEPDRERTSLEKQQLAAFIFKDESRRRMQVYNTGVGGSKLADFDAMSDNFIADTSMRKFIIRQFQGLSKLVKS